MFFSGRLSFRIVGSTLYPTGNGGAFAARTLKISPNAPKPPYVLRITEGKTGVEMLPQDYVMTPAGPGPELAALNLDEVLDHFENHLGNYLLDPAVASAYINRIASDDNVADHGRAIRTLIYISRKYNQQKPFDFQGLDLLSNLGVGKSAVIPLEILKKYTAPGDWENRVDAMLSRGKPAVAVEMLRKMRADSPGDALIADRLLDLETRSGVLPDPSMRDFSGPPALRNAWKRRLFNAYAAANAVDEALALWDELPGDHLDETTLNLAAEVMQKAGESTGARALYAKSLELDPLQAPVRRRFAELLDPTVPDASLLAEKTVNIYIYSHDKADSLAKTLESLARCDIGKAAIKILLNGCTDDSLAVAERARELFPENPFDLISLQVNVGAPAARNWLIAEPSTRQADYTCFLDDDVEPSEDFLSHFLSVAVANPEAGVVGCKTLSPGTPAPFQYLYRNVSVAKPGMLRLSLGVPSGQFDNNLYDFTRETENVMGCCHMFSRQALVDVPLFDLRFSPSQMDDIAHDLDLRLKGYKVVYCGLASCVHDQRTGNKRDTYGDALRFGNVAGNDVKFYYRFRDRLDALRAMRNASPSESAAHLRAV